MNREFLEIYNRELRILRESAKEFAEEFPGVAERLGGLLESNMDPMIGGLLEGTAFLASRVQLKLRHEYSEFTSNLLEQLVPDYLAPTPSSALLRIEPPFGDQNLKDGVKIAAGSYVEARFVERERRIACKYRVASDITLWPFDLAAAEFLPTAAALQGLGIEPAAGMQSGLRLSLVRRLSADRQSEPNGKPGAVKPEAFFSSCRADDLPFHIVCAEGDAVRIYEMLFGHASGLFIRYLDDAGDPVVVSLPKASLSQIGFEPDEALFPAQKRTFSGFDLLREFFVLPAKFLGFRISGLQRVLPRVLTNRMDIIITFGRSDTKLQPVVKEETFAMYAAPAVNLFEMVTSRVQVRPNEHEYHVIADRSRALDFEIHRLLKVHAHYAGSSERAEVYPLYAAPPLGLSETETLYYTARRLPRRRSQEERRCGLASQYVGTETYIMLVNHRDREDGLQVAELSARAWCSNRHLTEHVPVGRGGADFILEDNTKLGVTCVNGPTLPRDAIARTAGREDQATPSATPAWRLISMLSLNHLGITGRGTEDSAAALREILSLFANLTDAATERRVRGVIAVEHRPITRRVRQSGGAGVVRGLEIKVTLDEKAYEGSGIFIMGAVIERFFAEYAGINNVVETVICSNERGEVMRWPARLGRKVEL